MNKEFDLLVFVGRFHPFHVEHKRIIDIALEKANTVLVLVGSSGKSRTVRNPFTYEERRDMIIGAYESDWLVVDPEGKEERRLIIRPLYDKTYNDAAWIKQVQDIVKETALTAINKGGFHAAGLADGKIGLIGMAKDHTSYYLKMFPQFESVDVPMQNEIHATNIREHFLDGSFENWQMYDSLLPSNVCNWLFNEFKHTDEYVQLQNELAFVRTYKKSWEAAPYPVKFVTVDAVVEQAGHVLLVKRRSEPGKGLWAVPGGHLEQDEKIEDGIIRELKEETLIKVPEKVLRGSKVAEHVFDDPHRSTIGRVITHAAHFKLTGDLKLPKVKGADDAVKAAWIPVSDLREDMMFDDHYFMICHFLSLW